MNQNPIEEDSIRIYLDSQILMLKEDKRRLEQIKNEMSNLQYEEEILIGKIGIIEDSVSSYKSKIDYTESPNVNENDSNSLSGIMSRSPESTLKILKEKDSSDGMAISDILDKYKKIGIKTYHRQVSGHLIQLEQEEVVMRINPGQTSFKRYRAKLDPVKKKH